MQRPMKYIARCVKTGWGMAYDFYRLAKYSAMREDFRDFETRNYAVAKTYHALEKSLTFKERSSSSGWGQARSLVEYFRIARGTEKIGYHDIASLEVLEAFLTSAKTSDSEAATPILEQTRSFRSFLQEERPSQPARHGARQQTEPERQKAILDDPEGFFLSRSSVRFFLDQKVDSSLVERAVRMAMKSPTACNRQPWTVYFTSDTVTKDLALSVQSGNRGFGHQIPNLAIVAVDHRAYMSGEERNANLVDGAMFANTLVYAMHSLGLGACCLNWSRMPRHDRALRKALKIEPHHAIIMMIGFGFPDPEGKVCFSSRKPVNNVIMHLETRPHA